MMSFKAHRRQIFCVLGCLAALALCLWVWLTASGAFTPASAVVLFTDKNGATYLDSDRLAQQLTDCTLYTLDAEGDAAAQLEELQRTQKRETVRAAIVAADDRTTAASLVQQLAQTGLPVILAGPPRRRASWKPATSGMWAATLPAAASFWAQPWRRIGTAAYCRI